MTESKSSSRSVCAGCGDAEDTVAEDIQKVAPGGETQGVLSPQPLCERCRSDFGAPSLDGCLICGDEDTTYGLEFEGCAGVEEFDAYYSGSVCKDCSKDVVFDLVRKAAMNEGTTDASVASEPVVDLSEVYGEAPPETDEEESA